MRASSCDLPSSARTSGRLRPCPAEPRHTGRLPADAGPESFPAAAPFCCGLSAAPRRLLSPDRSGRFPCCWKIGCGSPSLFPCGPPCGTGCMSPRPAEWLPFSPPLRAALASSPLSAVPPQTAHLAAWRSHQILALTFADGLEILLAHDAAIQHPDPSRLSIFAFHHAQHRLQGRDVGAVAV